MWRIYILINNFEEQGGIYEYRIKQLKICEILGYE